MIIENTGLIGLKSELGYLDEVTTNLGFCRWQWEYYRATYDYKIEDGDDDYYLRINTRAIEGKLESKTAVLSIEDVYIGRATYPQGLDYDSEIPSSVLAVSDRKIAELRKQLA